MTEPVVHKYGVLNKLCHLSEMPVTHTSWVDDESSIESNCDRKDLFPIHEESESESDVEGYSRLTRSVSVPSLKKLEMKMSGVTRLTKTLYSNASETVESVINFNGKPIELVSSAFFSMSSKSSAMY